MKISLRSRSSGELSTGLISVLFILALSFFILMLSAAGAEAAYSPLHISRGLPGATSTGLPALMVNPAGVHVDNPGQFSVEFNMGGGLGNNYFDYDILTGAVQDENFSDIVEDLGENGLNAYAGGSGSLKVRAGPIDDFTGSVTGFFGAEADFSGTIGPGVFEFLEEADDKLENVDDIEDDEFFQELQDIRLDMGETEMGGAAFAGGGLSLSYDITEAAGPEVDKLTLGGTLHYRQGELGHFTADGVIEFNELIIEIDDLHEDLDTEETYETFAPEGTVSFTGEHSDSSTASGMGLDLGIYGEFDDRFSAGLSVENLTGSLSADSGYFIDGEVDIDLEELKDDVIERAEDYYGDPQEPDMEPEEALEEAFVDVMNDKIDDSYDERKGEEVSYSLPLTIRLEGAMEATDDVDVAGGITFASHDLGPNDVTLSSGVEFTQLSPLKIRSGLNYSSRRGSLAISSGLGLDFGTFNANLAFSDLRAIIGSAQSFETGLNLGLEF